MIKRLYVEYLDNGTSDHDPGDGGQWDGYTKSNKDIHEHGLIATAGDFVTTYYTEEIEFFGLMKSNEEAHVVCVKYTDGDTFGTTTGNMQYLAAFHDKERAEAMKRAVTSQYRCKREKDHRRLKEFVKNEFGESIFNVCWDGHFQRFEDCYIYTNKIRMATKEEVSQ